MRSIKSVPLIGSLRLRIVDVATGKAIFGRVLGFAATRMRLGNAPRNFLSAIWKRQQQGNDETHWLIYRNLRRLVGR